MGCGLVTEVCVRWFVWHCQRWVEEGATGARRGGEVQRGETPEDQELL